MTSTDSIASAIRRRTLLIDGAMGTVLHGCGFSGCTDMLNLSAPNAVVRVHRAYLEAGADIITTNTVNATLPAPDMPQPVGINIAAARIARAEAERYNRRFVAGSMGPTALPNPGCDDIMRLTDAYADQARALIEGGVDVLLVETATSIAGVKAAIAGINRARRDSCSDTPFIVSATPDADGRMLSGETLAALVAAVTPSVPLAIGLNCGNGPVAIAAPIREMAAITDLPLVLYPNAGLPGVTAPPDVFAAALLAASPGAAILGGCCGTTPAHIAALRQALKNNIQ